MYGIGRRKANHVHNIDANVAFVLCKEITLRCKIATEIDDDLILWNDFAEMLVNVNKTKEIVG